MTSDDIRDAIMMTGCGTMDNVIILDSVYSLPTKKWIAGIFANDYRANLWTLGVETYRPESGDCDDFAFLAFSIAKLCHRMNSGLKTGLAFGALLYIPSGASGAHAINIAVTGPDEVVFFEPQTGKIVELSDHEKASSYLVII